jgi:hypothetical protein
MGIISWIIFGLIAGILAKRLYCDRYIGDRGRRRRRLYQHLLRYGPR